MPQVLTFSVNLAIHFFLRCVVSVVHLVIPIPDFMDLIALFAHELGKGTDVMME